MKIARKKPEPPERGFLDGKMLIAMPGMRDERFTKSVIYVCAHSNEGAMGIIVNKPAADVDFPVSDLDPLPLRRPLNWVLQHIYAPVTRGLISRLV
jgi:putative transcriptional regulator